MSKLKQMLDKYRNMESLTLRAGIINDSHYADGQSVAYIAKLNEYGYDGMVKGRQQTIYHSINQDGSMRNDGRFVKASKANLARIVDVPDYHLKIPPRSFFRSTVANERKLLPAMIAKAVRGGADFEDAMHQAGQHMVDAFHDSVMTWQDPPNAPSTVASKGYNAPLRGKEKLLRKAFSYEIVND